MMIMTRKVLATAILLLLSVAPATFAQDSGSANLANYVALGDSLTAGFSSGGLAIKEQSNSYPALIARQIGLGAGFEQPLVSNPGIPAQLTLTSLSPLVIAPKGGSGVPLNLTLARPYNNLGVPGAEVFDTVNTVTDFGGLHDLILRGLGTAWQQALALQPTFASIWIGNNDALAAATSGLVIEGVTLTSAADFERDFRTLTSVMASNGVQMVLSTLPPVTAIPFVSTFPPVVTDATGAVVLVGGAPVPLLGPDGPLSSNDNVLLTASTLLAQGFGIPAALGGPGIPLPDEVVLSASEASQIQGRVDQFNAVIRAVATETDSALADNEAFFNRVSRNGLDIGGILFSPDLLTGGLFSYDGVHPTPLGYAVSANVFIRAINSHYGASIPLVDYTPYLFGEEGNIAIAPVTANAVNKVKMKKRAQKNLFSALGMPSIKELKRIKAEGGEAGLSNGASESRGGGVRRSTIRRMGGAKEQGPAVRSVVKSHREE